MTQLNNTVSKKDSAAKQLLLRPLVNVYENSDGITLQADLPGVDSDRLDIQIEGNILTLEGESLHSHGEAVKSELEMVQEGVYRRSFTLNEGLDLEKIDAELKSGLLTIKVPKKVAEAPKKITVRAA